jgi:hypothetical protein
MAPISSFCQLTSVSLFACPLRVHKWAQIMPTNPVQEIYHMKPFFFVVLSATLATAQTVIPDGTRLRVRLDQTLSSATADEGQTVELSVTEPVKIEERIVIPEGARVTGTVTRSTGEEANGARR